MDAHLLLDDQPVAVQFAIVTEGQPHAGVRDDRIEHGKEMVLLSPAMKTLEVIAKHARRVSFGK